MLLKYFLLLFVHSFYLSQKIISIDDLCMRPFLCWICMKISFKDSDAGKSIDTHIFLPKVGRKNLQNMNGGRERRNSNSSGKNNNKIAVCVSFLSAFSLPGLYLAAKTIVTPTIVFWKRYYVVSICTKWYFYRSAPTLCGFADWQRGWWRENNNNTFNLLSDLTLLMKRLSGRERAREKL